MKPYNHLIIKYIAVFYMLACVFTASGQQIALLKYHGGGDWYANPTVENRVLSSAEKPFLFFSSVKNNAVTR